MKLSMKRTEIERPTGCEIYRQINEPLRRTANSSHRRHRLNKHTRMVFAAAKLQTSPVSETRPNDSPSRSVLALSYLDRRRRSIIK